MILETRKMKEIYEVKLPQDIVNWVNGILHSEDPIKEYSAGEICNFNILLNSGFCVEIDVINGFEGPYIECNLFNEDGNLIEKQDGFIAIDGEYIFEFEENYELIVSLESEDVKEKETVKKEVK